MKNPLKNPNIKWLFGGIGAAVVGGWIVWKITGGSKPAPAQQITTPLYMPGSGGFGGGGGGGGGGGVGPMEDLHDDAVTLAQIMQATEMERIASQERMYMAGLQQSLEQSSPMYAPLTEYSPTTSKAVSLTTAANEAYNVSATPDRVIKAGDTFSSTGGFVKTPGAAPKTTRQPVPKTTQQPQQQSNNLYEVGMLTAAKNQDWYGLYNIASAARYSSAQVAAVTGLNYNEVVAWQQQQNLKVL